MPGRDHPRGAGRPSSAAGWLGGAAIVAAIVAGVLVWHTTAALT